MMRALRSILALAALTAVACSRNAPRGVGTSTAPDAAPPRSLEPRTQADDAGDATTACPGDAERGVTCRRFARAEDALRHVLARDVSMLAIGEAHAQKGTEAIASATRRFTDELLPVVAGRSADIVVELWAPDPKCKKEVEVTRSAQKPVTSAQAASNVNEYEALGIRAKSLGVTPWLLRPTCEDFSMLADAGADAVPAMLGLVKRLTLEKAERLLAKNGPQKKLTIAYGGALHNDVVPPESTAPYSFGPALVSATQGAYVELDLIVPEYVKKTAAWEKLPWFSAWQRSAAEGPPASVTLYTMATTPPSYALVFAATPPP